MSEEPRIFVTSDTNFFGQQFIAYAARPFEDVLDMNEHLIERWNEIVRPNDLVYHLGDFGTGPPDGLEEIHQRLEGKISILRSHSENSLNSLLELGFALVADQIQLDYLGYLCIFTHKPLVSAYSEGILNLHGYEYSKVQFRPGSINISCDAWDYKPVELKELIRKYKLFKWGLS